MSSYSVNMTVTDGYAAVQITDAAGAVTHEQNDLTVLEAIEYVERTVSMLEAQS